MGGAALLAIGVLAVPLALAPLELPTLSFSYGPLYQPFELMGLLAAIAALGMAAVAWRRGARQAGQAGSDGLETPAAAWTRAAPLLSTLAVTLFTIGIVSEFSTPSLDWGCYWEAAQAVVAGETPYGRCYIYPPLLAQILATLARVSEPVGGALGFGVDRADFLVFYAFQGGQVLAAALAAVVLQRLGRRWGMSPWVAAALTAALLIVDNPVLRTLRHNQINLWLLALTVLAVDVVRRRPLAAGGILALAIHIKLYPVVLLLPWVLARKWRAVGATVVATLVLGVVVTGRHPEQWGELVALGARVGEGLYFRNNSLLGLVTNVVGVPLSSAGVAIGPLLQPLQWVGMALSLLAGGALVWRMVRRRGQGGTATARLAADTADAFALQLLLSPIVWEHHFVLVIPVALHAAATVGRARLLWVVAGTVLMLWMPTADVLVLSHHRLAGLLMLLWATRAGDADG